MLNKSINDTIKRYKNFDDIFRYAYVGFPKGFLGLKKPFYGLFEEFNQKHTNIEKKRYPIVLYMHGSSGLSRGEVYRKYIVEEAGFIFFAPNSHKIKNRPIYKSPAKEKHYIKVHKIRVAEIEYCLNKLKKLPYVDKKNIFLMGNSEGGLAAAVSKTEGFRARIVTAFSCENSYFYKNFKVGFKKHTPFLNIIGTHDEFFSKKSKLNKNLKTNGHGIELLKKYYNSKIVVACKAKHDLTKNIYVKDEILNFLKLWKTVL